MVLLLKCAIPCTAGCYLNSLVLPSADDAAIQATFALILHLIVVELGPGEAQHRALVS